MLVLTFSRTIKRGNECIISVVTIRERCRFQKNGAMKSYIKEIKDDMAQTGWVCEKTNYIQC